MPHFLFHKYLMTLWTFYPCWVPLIWQKIKMCTFLFKNSFIWRVVWIISKSSHISWTLCSVKLHHINWNLGSMIYLEKVSWNSIFIHKSANFFLFLINNNIGIFASYTRLLHCWLLLCAFYGKLNIHAGNIFLVFLMI